MKTQIIQLEPHDDTISIKDKMGWSQTSRVALVWPARGQLMDRRLDLVLLKRHSQSLGVQIALVTRDPEVRFQASNLDIPVFRSIRKAQTMHWRRSRRKILDVNSEVSGQDHLARIQSLFADPLHLKRDASRLSQPVRILVFSLAVLAVLSIAAILIPSAKIYLTPAQEPQVMTITVRADDDVKEINLSGILPARWIDVRVEGRGNTLTTGSVSIPVSFASGEVVFTNLTDHAVFIPAGTVVSTANSEYRYLTQEDTRVPAGPDEKRKAALQAITPGSSSNQPRSSIVAVQGELGVLVSVDNPEPITGGSMTPSPAPNDGDRDRIRDELITRLAGNARREIKDNLNPGDLLLSQTPTLVEVVSESYDPLDLQPASELFLTLLLEFKMPYVAGEDLQAIADSILDANLPRGYVADSEPVAINHLSTPILDSGGTTPWKMRVSRDLRSEPSEEQVKSLVLGHQPEEASQLLMDNLALTSPPRFETSPSWWPVIPFLPIRVDVITSGHLVASHPVVGRN